MKYAWNRLALFASDVLITSSFTRLLTILRAVLWAKLDRLKWKPSNFPRYGMPVKRALSSWLLLFVFSVLHTSFAVETINTNAVLTAITTAAQYRRIGNSPGDGDAVYFNPPVFKWQYLEDITLQTDPSFYVSPRQFRFKLSTNGSFASPYWDIACSNNFYNFLPPITNADGTAWGGTCSWEVEYYTNGSTLVGTGPTHTFTLAPTATNWDRSSLADSNNIATKAAAHPHMWFGGATNNIAAMGAFVRGTPWQSPGSTWTSTTNNLIGWQGVSWWADSSLTNLPNNEVLGGVAGPFGVAFGYYMSGSNAMWDMPGACTTFDYFCTSFRQRGWDHTDPYSVDVGSEWCMGITYDWLYPFMTSLQRSNALYTLKSLATFCKSGDSWFYTSNTVFFDSAFFKGGSHERFCVPVGESITCATMSEDANMFEDFKLWMNYEIAIFDPDQGDEGHGYSEQSNFKFDREFGPYCEAITQFPEAQLYRNPILTNLSTFFAFLEPVGFVGSLGWGDYEFGFRSQWFNERYSDLALLTGNGAIIRGFNRAYSYPFRASTSDDFPSAGEVYLPYYFTMPAESDWPVDAYLDRERGYAIFNSVQPNDWGAFTNGIGCDLVARPAGTGTEHSVINDGMFDAWAYGAVLTPQGVATGYGSHPMYFNVPLVNGIGCYNAYAPPNDPILNQFIAYTNCSDFYFVGEDLTKGYNRSNYGPGVLTSTYPSYGYSSNTVPYVSSVKRYVISPHRRYWVIYDELQTVGHPSTFQTVWHVFEPTLAIDPATLSFHYTVTNSYNGSNITVWVKDVVDPSLMTYTNLSGTNLCKFNPWTGENLMGLDGDTGGLWNTNVIFSYNTSLSTNFHFMRIVFPTRWDDTNSPTITRLTDNTAHIVWGTNEDVVSFGETNSTYSAADNFVVNLGTITPSGGGGGGGATPFITSAASGTAQSSFPGKIGSEFIAAGETIKTLKWYVTSGDTSAHTVYIMDAGGTTILTSASVPTSGVTAGTWATVTITPFVTTSGTHYHLLGDVTSGGYTGDGSATVTTDTSIGTIVREVYVDNSEFETVTPHTIATGSKAFFGPNFDAQ